ncbi:Methyltransferase FkbM [Candidatus Nanopelagicaceae bacterium]
MKIVFRAIAQDGPYFRNQFGSIISPTEFRISWDPRLTDRAILLNELLAPIVADSKKHKLVRLGSVGDGGYFLPDYFRECDGVISGGISDNNDFESDLASSNIPVLQFDHSIVEPPISGELLFFKRERLGNGGCSLVDTLREFREATGKTLTDGILKLDIEGSEFDFLSSSEVNDLLNFSIIVVELHYLGDIYQDNYWIKVEDTLRKIRQNHKPITVIGNNSRAFVQLGGIPIYDIVEVTFIRNSAIVPAIENNEALTTQIEGRAALRIR